ncbi:carbohydrate kinase family protein [Paramicrobacterium agarici]|uniref:Fructokinase n=1 Tax=Paramicrobacterium agarici TaxID=630514 RepID=A0A2A9DRK7_9MICO|nr:PfkB family carbohydrate kinase [Microbacterium agarici]PFG29224.1 fructokinase [Microbacterium agarici]TQO22187.1 fructokinase [Microbacterium agarici]
MHSSPAPVAVIGDALIDELRDETGTRDFVGGAALNVAVGIARLGVPTTLIAMIGDDADGARIAEFLDQHGVGFVRTIGPNGTSRAVSDRRDGEPTYAFNEAARRRAIEFGPESRRAIADAPFTVVSCFPFDNAGQVEQLAASVPHDRRRLIIDPNPREGMMHSREEFVRGFESLASRCELIKVGEDDARMLYESTLDELVDRLVDAGAAHVVGTAGRDGGFVRRGARTVKRPIAELPGDIIDTMGAGDAVLAAIVRHLVAMGIPASPGAWEEVLERAMLVAAATCRFEGALLREP